MRRNILRYSITAVSSKIPPRKPPSSPAIPRGRYGLNIPIYCPILQHTPIHYADVTTVIQYIYICTPTWLVKSLCHAAKYVNVILIIRMISSWGYITAVTDPGRDQAAEVKCDSVQQRSSPT